MKKILTGSIFICKVCIILMLCFMLTGCGGRTVKNAPVTNIKIGVSVYNEYDTFVAELIDAMKKHAQELEKKYDITITLDIQNAGGNQVTQNDQMDHFIDTECDIVCINLVDRTDASTIIERGKSADIPIIFFNRELVEEDLQRWNKLYYVGADAFESGIIQGKVLIEYLEQNFDLVDRNGDGIIQYVMLEGEAGHQDSIVRTMYTINTVTEAGYEVEKLADEIANWNRDQGKTKMAQWVQEFGSQIEVVFSNNDDMALGALDAMKAAGYYDDPECEAPVVLGIDGTREALEAVEDGYFLGTVLNDSNGQAMGMLELAYAIATGNKLSDEFTLIDDKYIRLPYQKITRGSKR